ncbi:DUF1674 domain-containing protein [Bartonella sp. DGB2]|uniref:DUF1674 domain-containing protein n=1 Tax=Bartonella sp. DGB2 TaxID=3388426 RepID=UPI00398FE922
MCKKGIPALSEAAKRALHEAALRRAEQKEGCKVKILEVGGRGGKDPTRFGDWEIKGRAIDF